MISNKIITIATALHCLRANRPADETTSAFTDEAAQADAFVQTRGTAAREFISLDAEVEEGSVVHRIRTRAKLIQELDLRKVLDQEGRAKVRAWRKDENCETNAGNAFDDFLQDNADIAKEYSDAEKAEFRARVIEELAVACKHGMSEGVMQRWESLVKDAVEHEKPVVTDALVEYLNGLDLGFQTAAEGWVHHEPKYLMDMLLGRQQRDQEETAQLLQQTQERIRSQGTAAFETDLPNEFKSANKWPKCKDVIQRIHQQGECGSCWAFGSASALDSRICIASNGRFQERLSRTVITSCGSVNADGCQGGLSRLTFDYMKTNGVPTGGKTGCVPYFGTGEGTNHFVTQAKEPACSALKTCKVSMSPKRSFAEDAFTLPGVANYAERLRTNQGSGVQYLDVKRSLMEHGPIPYGIYADSSLMAYKTGIFSSDCGSNVNHEVTAIGWGKDATHGDFWYSLNSWGTGWGEGGAFRAANCVPFDFTIPGDITGDVSSFPSPWDKPQGPTPAPPPPTAAPPTPAPPPFTVKGNGCSLDTASGCVSTKNFPSFYGVDESCEISLGYPTIEVEYFQTEQQFDVLSVNGQQLSGSNYEGLNGLSPTTKITWTADFVGSAQGWKICQAGTSGPSPTPAPQPAGGQPDPSPQPTDSGGGWTSGGGGWTSGGGGWTSGGGLDDDGGLGSGSTSAGFDDDFFH